MSSSSKRGGSIRSVTSTDPSSPPLTSVDSVSTHNRSVEADVPSPEELARKPWKYIGYKGYSEFLASENDFYIFRKFEILNSRIALALQDQVFILEEELEELDVRYSSTSATDVNNGSFRDDQPDREELLEKIHDKLTKYSKLNIIIFVLRH